MNDPILFDINSVPVDFDSASMVQYYQDTRTVFINSEPVEDMTRTPILYGTAGEFTDQTDLFYNRVAYSEPKKEEKEKECKDFLANVEK